MKLGITTYTYMWAIGFEGARPDKPMTAIGLLEKAHDLGVKVVQVGPNLPLLKLSERDLDAFVTQAQGWGIELELATRGIETTHLTGQIMLAKRIGARLLRTIAEVGGQPPDYRDIPMYLRAIQPLLEKEDIKLGLENGRIPADEVKWVLDGMRHPLIGVVLDTINSLAVPEGYKYVAERLAPYTMCLHLKDYVIKRVWSMMGFVCEGRPAGQGQVDIPWLLKAVKAASPYDFNVIVELWPPEQNTLAESIALEEAWAVESVALMRQYVRD